VIGGLSAMICDSDAVIGHPMMVIGNFSEVIGDSRHVIGHPPAMIADSTTVIRVSLTAIRHSSAAIGDSLAAIGERPLVVGHPSAVPRGFHPPLCHSGRVDNGSRRSYLAPSQHRIAEDVSSSRPFRHLAFALMSPRVVSAGCYDRRLSS
jgi:hypothetical protein